MKNWLLIILLILGICSGLVIWKQRDRINSLNNEVAIVTSNIKAYELENSELKNKSIEFQYTVDQLNYSNDSLVQKLNDLRKDLKIKDKAIEELAYIASETSKVDSIYIKDTIFVKDAVVDTLISDDWSSLHLHLEYPGTITTEMSFNNETAIIASSEKVTIDPPKKFFIARWFQKKHNIVTVDVIESNPYCKTKEQRFIKITN